MNPIKNFIYKKLSIVVALVIAAIALSSVQVIAASLPVWSYSGDTNPTHWSELSPDFAACELGREQSPIDITDAVQGNPAPIVFNYSPTPLVIFNTGRTIQVNYAPGSTVTLNGEEYTLLQFHFHTPSEHTIEGKASAMELHLVHRNATGKLAVASIMMKEGVANPLIEQIWQQIPAAGQTTTVKEQTINAANFLPKNKAYYSYSGSLTTPPCSESVKWNVLVEPITVSGEEIKVFQKLYQADARTIQPTNGRVVELHSN